MIGNDGFFCVNRLFLVTNMWSSYTVPQGTHYIHYILPSAKLYYKLRTLLDDVIVMKENGQKSIIIGVEHENRKRLFLNVTFDELSKVLQSLDVSKRTLYEVLCEKKNCKLYFDVDIHITNSLTMNVEESLLILQNLFHCFILDWTNKYTKKSTGIGDHFLVLCATTEAKYSYHLIYTNTEIRFHSQQIVFKFIKMLLQHCSYFILSHPCHEHLVQPNSMNAANDLDGCIKCLQMILMHIDFCSCIIPETKVTCKNFQKLLFKNSDGLYQWIFDLNVYSNNQQFRLYQSTKFGKHNPLLPTSDFPFNPCNKQYDISMNNDGIDHSMLKHSLIAYISDDSNIVVLSYNDNKWVAMNEHDNSITELTPSYNFADSSTIAKFTIQNNLIQATATKCKQDLSNNEEYYKTFIFKLMKETYHTNGHIQSCQKGSKNRSILFFNIGGDFRFCERLQRHHKSNQTCIIIDTFTNNYQIKSYFGKEIDLDRSQPSLTHIFAVRGMLGKKMQTFDADASEYIQPYLNALNSNKPHVGISSRAITSYEQAVERRGAEMIVRIASNIQYMKNILEIIHEVNNIDFHECNQNFIDQVEAIIQLKYGLSTNNLPKNTALATNTQSKMIITKQTCEESVSIFLSLLMPQHFTLMNSRINNDVKETQSELTLQTKIVKLTYRVFHKTTLHGNDGILKNIDKDLISYLLERMVRRGILKKGYYLKSEHSVKYESYLKHLPSNELEQQELVFELNKHHVSWEEYQEIYENSYILPANTSLTADGFRELQNQYPYGVITNDTQIRQSPLISNPSNSLQESTTAIHHLHTLNPSSSDAPDNQQTTNTAIQDDPSLNLSNITTGDISVLQNYPELSEILQLNTGDREINCQRSLTSTVNRSNNQSKQTKIGHHAILEPKNDDSSISEMEVQQQGDIFKQESASLDNLQNIIDTSVNHENSTPAYKETEKNRSTSQDSSILQDETDVQQNHASKTLSLAVQHQSEMINQDNLPLHEIETYKQFKTHVHITSTPDEFFSNSNQPNHITIPASGQCNEKSDHVHKDCSASTNGSQISEISSKENLSREDSNKSKNLEGSSSSSKNALDAFDPVRALEDPKTIPRRIMLKCKQMLLFGSPIITKTSWNRRFGGDSDLCQSAVQLLFHAKLLLEGQFTTTATKSYLSWIKILPNDSTNIAITLNFQQKKLDIFGITWEQYASSFKKIEFGHNNATTLISKEGAEILRSKPYQDVGFIMDESIVLTKKSKNSETLNIPEPVRNPTINESESSVSMMSVEYAEPDLTLDNVANITLVQDDSDSNSSAANLASTAVIPSQAAATSPSSDEIQTIHLNSVTTDISSNASASTNSSTPKRTRRLISPIRTRSKSRRIEN
ncbi:hypothetical protein I4U23_016867 [Adineta vaga]|nr:hypothetical protein I4U23_016867 [Adineta vaga]